MQTDKPMDTSRRFKFEQYCKLCLCTDTLANTHTHTHSEVQCRALRLRCFLNSVQYWFFTTLWVLFTFELFTKDECVVHIWPWMVWPKAHMVSEVFGPSSAYSNVTILRTGEENQILVGEKEEKNQQNLIHALLTLSSYANCAYGSVCMWSSGIK